MRSVLWGVRKRDLRRRCGRVRFPNEEVGVYRCPRGRDHVAGPLGLRLPGLPRTRWGSGSIGKKEDTMDDIQVAEGVDFDLDVRIVDTGPVAAALLGSTDNGCDTQKSGDC